MSAGSGAVGAGLAGAARSAIDPAGAARSRRLRWGAWTIHDHDHATRYSAENSFPFDDPLPGIAPGLQCVRGGLREIVTGQRAGSVVRGLAAGGVTGWAIGAQSSPSRISSVLPAGLIPTARSLLLRMIQPRSVRA